MDRPGFLSAASSLGLNLTEGQVAQFEAFEEDLYRVNQSMNLTRVPREDCWLRHFVDSLLIQDLVAYGSDALDIGTGPGFPAWPLACARPDLKVTAVESNGKMLGFLRSQMLPNLEIVQVRAEEWNRREAYDVVTGRAVAPLPIQLELSAAPCRVGGRVVPMRTSKEDLIDASALGLELEESITKTLPATDAVRVFPIYRKVSKTPRPYPRRWPEMKSKPLGAR
ncbi:MAG TPA: 16S rRNA (guanine(527)-N(7))-methyltransferase RsmG [Fimbriimonas sp.]